MVNFSENIAMLYNTSMNWNKYNTWFAIMDTTKSFEDPDIIIWEKVNDEFEGDDGPSQYYDGIQFPTLGKIRDKLILYVPNYVKTGYLQDDYGKYMYFGEDLKWKPLKLDINLLINGNRGAVSNLVNNKLLHFGGYVAIEQGSALQTHPIIGFVDNDDYLHRYELGLYVEPPASYGCQLAKIDEGIVMLFGGTYKTTGTWVFMLTDSTSIIENLTDTNNIFFEHNILLLQNLESVELYDIMGNLLKKYNQEESYIDLNYLPSGVYFIRYYDGKKYISKKFIKY